VENQSACVQSDGDDWALVEKCARACRELKAQLAQSVIGQEAVIDLMLITLLARGHALLVGVPGLAKTLLVSSLSSALGLSFGRIQFTPDLLPADITGTDILNEIEIGAGRTKREVVFMPGPIFKNLVLGDEINRTPPKTQAALLQAMQERNVTVGGATHQLPNPFHVFATRNPIEQEGTYPLPEAQLDRFLLEVHVEYPSQTEEIEIARRTTSGLVPEIRCVVSEPEVLDFGRLVPRIPITDEAVELAVRVTRITRPGAADVPAEVTRYVRFGAGPRGCQSLVLCAKARAAAAGHAAADLDDVFQRCDIVSCLGTELKPMVCATLTYSELLVTTWAPSGPSRADMAGRPMGSTLHLGRSRPLAGRVVRTHLW
jgi:MoxR-like ATPase